VLNISTEVIVIIGFLSFDFKKQRVCQNWSGERKNFARAEVFFDQEDPQD
jgi:hypothetical protein